MSEFTGQLNINSSISRLGNDLLLASWIPNEEQVKFAATGSLEDESELHSGDISTTTRSHM